MSNEDRVTVSAHGNTTRVEWGADAQQQQQEKHHGTPANGTFRLKGVDGRVSHEGVSRVSGEDIIREAHGTGILGTANELTLRPTTRVTVGGVEMELVQAERMGYVRRDAYGRYVDPSQTQAQPQQQQPQQAQAQQPKPVQLKGAPGDIDDMQQEAFHPEIEQQLGEMVKDVPAPMVNRALIDSALALASQDNLEEGAAEKIVERIVSNTGVSPAFIVASITALSHQADGAIKAMGVDPEAFIDWAKREQPKALENAMVTHVGARSLNGYRELAQEFIRTYVPTAEGLAEAGYETRRDAQGELLVLFQGEWASAKSLARQGLI